MDAKEKRQLETQLLKWGWPGLKANGDPSRDFVQFVSDIVNNHIPYENRQGEWIDQHKFFRNLLNECDACDRTNMYEAIAPRLKFKALPLEQYELMIQEKAGSLVSKRGARVEGQAPKPIQVGEQVYVQAPKDVATAVVATLVCHKCNKAEKFRGETAATAMIAGRKAGWTLDKAIRKETCPECTAEYAQEEIVTLSRNEKLVVNDKRRVN